MVKERSMRREQPRAKSKAYLDFMPLPWIEHSTLFAEVQELNLTWNVISCPLIIDPDKLNPMSSGHGVEGERAVARWRIRLVE
jgi:hypothetical protein